MKISFNYEPLVAMLSATSTVVEDAMSSEDLKNVIFKVSKETKLVEVIGINQLITYRQTPSSENYTVEVEDDEFGTADALFMQIKSKELLGALNVFKSMHKTKVTGVSLENVENKVKIIITEEEIDTSKELRSGWKFDNIPVKPNTLPMINLQMPVENRFTEESVKISLYVDSLLPIMTNGTNLYSKMVFGENRVVAFNPAFTTLMNNSLSEVFRGFSLSYRAISFIKNVICAIPIVTVAKTPQYLCFSADGVEAFVRYDNKTADYSLYERLFTKDFAVVLDRQYFRDVLKRLSLASDAVEVKIEANADSIVVQNSKFSQSVPITNSKGLDALGSVSFKVLPDVMNKAIIGDDSQFSNSVFMYFAPTQNGGYSLVFSDDSGFWFSVASIR